MSLPTPRRREHQQENLSGLIKAPRLILRRWRLVFRNTDQSITVNDQSQSMSSLSPRWKLLVLARALCHSVPDNRSVNKKLRWMVLGNGFSSALERALRYVHFAPSLFRSKHMPLSLTVPMRTSASTLLQAPVSPPLLVITVNAHHTVSKTLTFHSTDSDVGLCNTTLRNPIYISVYTQALDSCPDSHSHLQLVSALSGLTRSQCLYSVLHSLGRSLSLSKLLSNSPVIAGVHGVRPRSRKQPT